MTVTMQLTTDQSEQVERWIVDRVNDENFVGSEVDPHLEYEELYGHTLESLLYLVGGYRFELITTLPYASPYLPQKVQGKDCQSSWCILIFKRLV